MKAWWCRELAEAAVARRAWALLRNWGGEGLRQDLALLAIHAAQHGRSSAEDSEERFWEFLLVHYHEVWLTCCHKLSVPRPSHVFSGIDIGGLLLFLLYIHYKAIP